MDNLNNKNGSDGQVRRYIQRGVEECAHTFNLFPEDVSLQIFGVIGLLTGIVLFVSQNINEREFGILFLISVGIFFFSILRHRYDIRRREEMVVSVSGVFAELSPEEINSVKRILNYYYAREYKSMVGELAHARDFEKLKEWVFIKEMQRRFRV